MQVLKNQRQLRQALKRKCAGIRDQRELDRILLAIPDQGERKKQYLVMWEFLPFFAILPTEGGAEIRQLSQSNFRTHFA